MKYKQCPDDLSDAVFALYIDPSSAVNNRMLMYQMESQPQK
jgi:hypothetical protein